MNIAADQLTDFVTQVLASIGMPQADVTTVAGLMIEADLRGADSHGVFRLPAYVKRIRSGGINLQPDIRVVNERSASALIDGDNAIGHLVMKKAADLAIDKARSSGVAWVGARMSNHAGPAGLYARMPLAHDMIGIYMAVGSANHLPPWGGIEMLLSTNPIAIAVPGDHQPAIVLDMATTNAAYGKVKARAAAGEPMPEGWMVDRLGKALLDPTRANEGFLLPIGGPKGYGLALMFGLLAGTLNGAAFGREVVDFNADFSSTTNTGHLIIAVDIAAFIDPVLFKAQVDGVWAEMKNAQRLPGVDEIRLPGEQSNRLFEKRTQNGIPIPAALQTGLRELADQLGVSPLG